MRRPDPIRRPARKPLLLASQPQLTTEPHDPSLVLCLRCCRRCVSYIHIITTTFVRADCCLASPRLPPRLPSPRLALPCTVLYCTVLLLYCHCTVTVQSINTPARYSGLLVITQSATLHKVAAPTSNPEGIHFPAHPCVKQRQTRR
jgi:hypothetical protein